MNTVFFDQQDKLNPLNGSSISAPDQVIELLKSLMYRPPFFCKLLGANGYHLLLGIGDQYGCAQYSSNNGMPPYMMAISDAEKSNDGDEYVEFLTGDTPTPISKRYCLTPEETRIIASHFVLTGQRYNGLKWEEI